MSRIVCLQNSSLIEQFGSKSTPFRYYNFKNVLRASLVDVLHRVLFYNQLCSNNFKFQFKSMRCYSSFFVLYKSYVSFDNQVKIRHYKCSVLVWNCSDLYLHLTTTCLEIIGSKFSLCSLNIRCIIVKHASLDCSNVLICIFLVKFASSCIWISAIPMQVFQDLLKVQIVYRKVCILC